jgi:Fe-S-cluster-containing hydrogenase component 2
MVACPFGVMQIVLTPVQEGRVKATAHKCDLCSGREEGPPACKTARPKRWCWRRTARW